MQRIEEVWADWFGAPFMWASREPWVRDMAQKGILIAVEGLDGSGKSTQAHLLVRWLEALSLPVHHTEWNSSPLVKQATKAGKTSKRLVPSTFHLIHAADFADRTEQQIEPMLAVGGIVVCDRYKFTAMARDGARGVPRERIENIYSFAREPDLTLFFDAAPAVTLDRILKGRPQLKWYEAGMDMGWTEDPYESYRLLQTKMHEIYSGLCEEGRLVRIDALGQVTEVHARVRAAINEHLDLSEVHRIDLGDSIPGGVRWSPGLTPSLLDQGASREVGITHWGAPGDFHDFDDEGVDA